MKNLKTLFYGEKLSHPLPPPPLPLKAPLMVGLRLILFNVNFCRISSNMGRMNVASSYIVVVIFQFGGFHVAAGDQILPIAGPFEIDSVFNPIEDNVAPLYNCFIENFSPNKNTFESCIYCFLNVSLYINQQRNMQILIIIIYSTLD